MRTLRVAIATCMSLYTKVLCCEMYGCVRFLVSRCIPLIAVGIRNLGDQGQDNPFPFNKNEINQISFKLYPTHSGVGRGNVVSRHSVPHFPPSSGGIAC